MAPPVRACSVFSIFAAVVGIAMPAHLCGQHAAWITQLEGNAGWWLPGGYETRATGVSGSETTVDLQSSLAYGIHASFPIANWPTSIPGTLSIGMQGLFVPGAEMKTATTDVAVGSADHYQLTATLAAGEFVGGTPITATFIPVLGVGLARTVLKPATGFTVADEERATTSLVLNTALGIDFLLAPAFSIVTQAGANLGIRRTDDATVSDWSFSFLGGIGIRLPLNGGPRQ